MVSRPFQVLILVLMAFLLALTCATTQAEVIDEVVRDFQSISGYVIMEVEGEFLIDLDTSKGISMGDLFSVVQPGKKIVHPVSGKVLGTLEEVKGILKVTRLQSGYSYARPLGKAKGIKRGDPIRRYANIPVLFWDYTGKGEQFFTQLRNSMPDLKWKDYSAAQAAKPKTPSAPKVDGPTLIFILKKDGLEVRDAEFQIIHEYGPPESLAAAGVVTGLAVASRPPPQKAPYKLEKPRAKPEKGITYEATFPGFLPVGALPGATVMADFIRHDDRLLMASTNGTEVSVFLVADKEVSLIAEGKPRNGSQILSVKWWRPADKGPLYVAVTSLFEHNVQGTIFVLDGKKLVLFKDRLDYFLGTFDRNGDGIRETLLRQSFDRDLFWGREFRQYKLVRGKLKHSRPGFKLPSRFTVLGSLFADVTGDGRLETIMVRDKSLYIYRGKKQLYKSPPGMGGTLSVATYDVNPDAKDIYTNSGMVEVSPFAADLDGDGGLELVSVASDDFLFTAPGIFPRIDHPRLAVVKYRDGMFVKGTLGEEVGNPVQGLTVAEGHVLFVATDTGSVFGKNARTDVLAFRLAQP